MDFMKLEPLRQDKNTPIRVHAFTKKTFEHSWNFDWYGTITCIKYFPSLHTQPTLIKSAHKTTACSFSFWAGMIKHLSAPFQRILCLLVSIWCCCLPRWNIQPFFKKIKNFSEVTWASRKWQGKQWYLILTLSILTSLPTWR